MKYEIDIEKLAKSLRTTRAEAGLSLAALSAQIDVGDSTILRVERRETPTIAVFVKLCNWLQMPPGAFFKEVEK